MFPDKQKRLINVIVPVTACNMRCQYCYVSQMGANSGKVTKLPFDVETVAKAFSVERLGGKCLLQLCGNGETLIPPYIVKLVRLFLEDGHYVFITTNGTLTNKIDAMLQFPQELRERLGFKFSYHYLELKRLGKLDVFFENAKKIHAAHSSVCIEAGAFDDCAPFVDEMRDRCYQEMGALPHAADIHDGYPHFNRLTKKNIQEHFTTWDKFKSPVFEFQKREWLNPIKGFCYGGDWFLQVYLENGQLQPCIGGGNFIGNLYENMDKPLHYVALGQNCVCPHCYGMHCYLTIGLVPSMQTPHYDVMRNRVMADGSEWLTATLRDFMHCKLTEANAEYSSEKKAFINALMSVEYDNSRYIYDRLDLASMVMKNLHFQGIYKIVVAGSSKLTTWLCELLQGTEISVAQLDLETGLLSEAGSAQSFFTRLKSFFNAHKSFDALVIADNANFETLKKDLDGKIESRQIVPITELVI